MRHFEVNIELGISNAPERIESNKRDYLFISLFWFAWLIAGVENV